MTEEISDISNYILKDDIGKGNFGKVKLGIYKPTNEEFAIKIINKKMIKIKMKNVIFKENEIITKFNHINVIYVYQIIDTPENYYIIMEYCKRGELFDYIVKNKKIKEDEASIFFYQLINGLEYIHSKVIAHRDLKPENILLTEDKILKIIDFGLSHEFNGEDFLKTKCGSPSYASPEIISHPLYDGFKTDIWCCGIILYAMLCGYLPFDGDDNEKNNNTLFKNIIECNLEFPDFVSEMGKDLICKLLTVEPDKRITIPEIKNHSFYLKGKYLCKLDYNLIEENIIKKRNYKNTLINSDNKNNINTKNKKIKNISKELDDKKTNNTKNLKIEIDDNYNINNEEDKKNNRYYLIENITQNNNINQIFNNINKGHINTDCMNYNNSTQLYKNMNNNIINNHKLNIDSINLKNNQIINTEINKYNYNPNYIPMLNISKNFNKIDKIFNKKNNYTKTLEQDTLYNNNYLFTLNKDKNNNNIFKTSFRDILKDDKNSLYINIKNYKNKYLKTLEKPEYILDKKNNLNSNDNKTFNDEIFLRNFRNNLIKREKLNKEKNPHSNNVYNLYQKKNNTINIDNKNSRIISLSNDNKTVKKNLYINDKSFNLNNIKQIINNYDEKNNIMTNNRHVNTRIKIIHGANSNNTISPKKYKKYELYKDTEYNNDNSNLYIKENNNNSFINQPNKNLISINKENYINPLNKEHIYKSENNYKRKGLSLQKNYRKIDDKINLSKLIQSINQENEDKKSVNKKKNKSFFNRYNLKNKTIESYNTSNRNSTIENNRIPLNLTKKMKNYNFDKINDIKNINEELMKNIFNKNRRNIMRIKNNDIIKKTDNHFLPILTDNNRNVQYNIKKI